MRYMVMHKGFSNLSSYLLFSNSILSNSTAQMAETNNTESILEVMMIHTIQYPGQHFTVALHYLLQSVSSTIDHLLNDSSNIRTSYQQSDRVKHYVYSLLCFIVLCAQKYAIKSDMLHDFMINLYSYIVYSCVVVHSSVVFRLFSC